MDEQDFFCTIGANVMAEFKDRGSRFLAYAYPIQSVDEFKNILQQLKISPVRKNGFIDYMKSIGKLGGQNKLPRLSNDRKIAEDLQKYVN